MPDFDYDLFVIGAGSGGVRASRIAASLGARVAVAEERYLGGTCVNVGCVPKKLFSYAAHFHDDLQDARGFGWAVPEVAFDWDTLRDNKDKEIKRLNGIYESLLEDAGVRILEGRARLSGPNRVTMGSEEYTARRILLAVGGWPWNPEYPGAEHAITSNEVFYLERLPESIVIVGGGYIAVEFASIFSRLGTKTTLVYRRDTLLRGFDAEIRGFITAAIGQQVALRLEDDVANIAKTDNGLAVTLKSGCELSCEQIMLATGRRPLTDDLGLDSTSVELTPSGAIKVNDRFQTAESSIYAVGDVIDRVALTPVALAEGQLVARALFAGDVGEMEYRNVPTAVFCHPNLGTVGLSEEQALAQGHQIDVYSSVTRPLKHTLSGSEERAMLKLVVDRADERVLGLHIASADAGEIVQGFAVALNCGATKADFDRTIGIHPTLAEELVTLRSKRESAT